MPTEPLPLTIKEIQLPGWDLVTLEQEGGLDGLGYFDESTGRVVIEREQPEIGKHVILVHELLHVVESALAQVGIQRPPEEFVTNAAPILLGLLIRAGVYTAADIDDLCEFMDGEREDKALAALQALLGDDDTGGEA